MKTQNESGEIIFRYNQKGECFDIVKIETTPKQKNLWKAKAFLLMTFFAILYLVEFKLHFFSLLFYKLRSNSKKIGETVQEYQDEAKEIKSKKGMIVLGLAFCLTIIGFVELAKHLREQKPREEDTSKEDEPFLTVFGFPFTQEDVVWGVTLVCTVLTTAIGAYYVENESAYPPTIILPHPDSTDL